MKIINSRQNPFIKEVLKIKSKPSEVLLIEGHHLVAMALGANLVNTILSTEDFKYPAETVLISKDIALKLSDKVTPEGVFALIKKPNLPLDLNKHLLYLDEINDPGNLGTILRSALAFDFGGVLLSPGSVSAYNPKVLSSGQGAHFLLPVKTIDSSELIKFKHNGYDLVTTDVKAGVEINSLKTAKVILILGNETRGVSQEINELADYRVNIPIKHIDSLNVAIAGSILMYELIRQ